MPIYTPVVVTDSLVEPVSRAELKLQAGIDDPEDATDVTNLNTLLDIHIGAARRYVESKTNRTIHQKTLKWLLRDFPDNDYIILPRATPLISISSLVYIESDGTSNTWAAANYIADTVSEPGRVYVDYGGTWPSYTPYPVWPVQVTYLAGIATTSPVTEASHHIKIPVLMFAAHLYENREAVNVADRGAVAQVAVKFGLDDMLSDLIVPHYEQEMYEED